MITDLWIENFKGIGAGQHIPLHPLTLLFGSNSAGKSTVLHALLYLREIVCHGNIDPKRSMAGAQTINLGGFSNLLHRTRDGYADALTIRCKFRQARGGGGLPPHFWEFNHYEFDTSSYGHGWIDPDTEIHCSEIADKNSAVNTFEFIDPHFLDDDIAWEMMLKIAKSPETGDPEIRHFKLLVNDQPLISAWYGNGGNHFLDGWWVNVQHPLIDSEQSHSDDSIPRKQFAERLQRVIGNEESDTPLINNGYCTDQNQLLLNNRPLVWCEDVLICPAEPKLSREAHPFFPSSTLIPLSDFLHAMVEAGAKLAPFDFIGISDSFVGIDKGLEYGDLNAALRANPWSIVKCVAVCAESIDQLPMAVFLVRMACLQDGMAVPFYFDFIPNALPGTEQVGMQIEVSEGDYAGLTPCGATDLTLRRYNHRRALVNQHVKRSLWELRQTLNSFCYIGPKRRTISRSFDSREIDDYADWGDGTGAWRWLLNADPKSLDLVSSWLRKSEGGLGTGLSIERLSLLEVDDAILKQLEEAEKQLSDACLPLGQHSEQTKHSIDASVALSLLKTLQELLQRNSSEIKEELRHSTAQRLVLRDTATNTVRHPQDLGEGITQVIPILSAMARRVADSLQQTESFIAIEQPELHLHPALAARLADIFVMAAACSGHHLNCLILIETHSEHLILRILRRIRQTTNGDLPEHVPKLLPDDVSVVWVDNLGKGTTFQRLRIDEQGEFIDRWPRGFFSERAEELY
jgi:predicted ATPase